MPDGDVTPDNCERAHWRFSSSDQRPYYQIPASMPKDQSPIEPREGLDTEAYPPLPQSEGVGIGGVQGYDKNPENLPLRVPAQRRTETELRLVEATRPLPTTTPKPSEELHGVGSDKSRREPVVQLKRLPKELDQLAHQTLSRRSDPGTRTAAATEGSPEVEAMEVEAPPEWPSPSQPHWQKSRKLGERSPPGRIPEEAQGNSGNQQSLRTPPAQDRSTRRAAPRVLLPLGGPGQGCVTPMPPPGL